MKSSPQYTFTFVLLAAFTLFSYQTYANPLRIKPVYQESTAWCWAAVSEMVLKYYRVPTFNQTVSYQCGIVNTLGGPCFDSCGNCIITIGNTMNMSQVLNNYQQIIRNFNRSNFRAFSVKPVGRISVRDIKNNINQKNPVIVGISPSGMGTVYPPGMSEHVALIIGYKEHANNLWLKINDPMPYLYFGFDPYLAAYGQIDSNGSHWITYQQLVNRLGYKDTILVSRLDQVGR